MRWIWVFGYGSLMWKPGFDFLGACHARLHGYHRSLCVYSWVHRVAQRQRPGLVFGLDQGRGLQGDRLSLSRPSRKRTSWTISMRVSW